MSGRTESLRNDATAVTVPEARSTSALNLLRTFVETHPVLAVFLVAFIARAFVAIAIDTFLSSLVQADGLMYHELATQMSNGRSAIWDDFTVGLYWRTAAYLVPLTALYEVAGPNMLLGSLYAASLGAGTAAAVTAIARPRLGRWAVVPGLILALLPSSIFWSSVTLKDPMVWFLLSLLAVVMTRAAAKIENSLAVWAISVALLLGLLAYTRQHVFVIACWAVALTAWVGVAKRTALVRTAVALTLAIGVPWAVGLGPGGWTLIHGRDLAMMRILNAQGAASAIVDAPEDISEILDARRASDGNLSGSSGDGTSGKQPGDGSEETTEGEDGLVFGEDGTLKDPETGKVYSLNEEGSLTPQLRHLPRGLSVMLFEPFPWTDSTSTSLNLARAETAVWYPILLLAFLGLTLVWKLRVILAFPVVVGGAILLVYALTEGNIGTAFRHRSDFVWVVAILASVGMHALATRRGRASDPS